MANSTNSQPKGKRSTSATAKNKPQIGAAEALQILNSAVNYCTQAGLSVTYVNRDGKLILFISGAFCDPDRAGATFLPLLAGEGDSNEPA